MVAFFAATFVADRTLGANRSKWDVEGAVPYRSVRTKCIARSLGADRTMPSSKAGGASPSPLGEGGCSFPYALAYKDPPAGT